MSSDADRLRAIAGHDWASQICSVDPLFSDLLPPAAPSLAAAIEEVLEKQDTEQVRQLAEALPLIEQRMEQRHDEHFDDVILGIAGALAGRADLRPVFARRFGLDGEPPGTLAESADLVGLHRERMRQIEERVVQQLGEAHVYIPTLDRALELLADHAPLDADEASQQLVDACSVSQSQPVEGVLRSARFMGREPGVEVDHRNRVVHIGKAGGQRDR